MAPFNLATTMEDECCSHLYVKMCLCNMTCPNPPSNQVGSLTYHLQYSIAQFVSDMTQPRHTPMLSRPPLPKCWPKSCEMLCSSPLHSCILDIWSWTGPWTMGTERMMDCIEYLFDTTRNLASHQVQPALCEPQARTGSKGYVHVLR